VAFNAFRLTYTNEYSKLDIDKVTNQRTVGTFL